MVGRHPPPVPPPTTLDSKTKRSHSVKVPPGAGCGGESRANGVATDSDPERGGGGNGGNGSQRMDESLVLPLSLIKGRRRKSSKMGTSSSGSSKGGDPGSGNNSDNSALVSLGNDSFGFNFDSEEAMLNGISPPNSEVDNKNGESDSDGGQGGNGVGATAPAPLSAGSPLKAPGSARLRATGAQRRQQLKLQQQLVLRRRSGTASSSAVVPQMSDSGQVAGEVGGDGGGVGQEQEQQEQQQEQQEQHQQQQQKQQQHALSVLSKLSLSSLNSREYAGSEIRSVSVSSDSGSRHSGSGSSRSSTVPSLAMLSNSNSVPSLNVLNSGINGGDGGGAFSSSGNSPGSHEEAAAAAVAHLQSIANAFNLQKMVLSDAQKSTTSAGTKRKAEDEEDYKEEDNESGGYNSDDAHPESVSAGSGQAAAPDQSMSSSSAGHAAMAASKQAALAAQVQKFQQIVPSSIGEAALVSGAMPTIMPLREVVPTTSAVSLNPSVTALTAAAVAVKCTPLAESLVVPLSVSPSSASSVPVGCPLSKKAKKNLDHTKREERNAREKERSFRISRQISELRNLLSSGGVIVPKGTKSSVLTEAANYIRMLQQHQYRSEIDRHQLVQQMQIIGSGALGPQAAAAIRHVAAQNGVWSLGNFGGVPPRSAMSIYQQSHSVPGTTLPDKQQPLQEQSPSEQPQQEKPTQQRQDPQLVTNIDEHEYRYVFNSCSVGMLSQYSKQEVCSMTIFNLTSRQDLQPAFDLISKMISPPPEGSNQNPLPCVLRGAMKHRNDLGLSIALIKGGDGIAKCFCVTLIKNPASPFDTSRTIPATADFILQPSVQLTAVAIDNTQKSNAPSGSLSTPAYTTG